MNRLDPNQRMAGVALLGWMGVLFATYFINPGTTSWLPKCPFHELTGLYCPGCGATRTLYQIMHGHPLPAAHENAIVLLAVPLVLFSLTQQLFGRTSLILRSFTPSISNATATVLILFTVARNIPGKPFQLLAPLQIWQS